jgi:hypothetical protein
VLIKAIQELSTQKYLYKNMSFGGIFTVGVSMGIDLTEDQLNEIWDRTIVVLKYYNNE